MRSSWAQQKITNVEALWKHTKSNGARTKVRVAHKHLGDSLSMLATSTQLFISMPEAEIKQIRRKKKNGGFSQCCMS